MDDLSKVLTQCEGFNWDEGNREKNWKAHKVTWQEAEQTFANKPIVINEDRRHSISEIRYGALGVTDKRRRLFIAFTVRKKRIRVISARDQDRRERIIYGEIEKQEAQVDSEIQE